MTKYERKTFLMDLQAASGNMEALLQLQYDLLERFSKYLPVRQDPVDPVKLREAIAKLTEHLASYPQPDPGPVAVPAPLAGDKFADLFSILEAKDLKVWWIVMSARDYADLRKWGSDWRTEVVSDRDFNLAGWQMSIFGAKVIVPRGAKPGLVHLVAGDSEYGDFGEVLTVTVTR